MRSLGFLYSTDSLLLRVESTGVTPSDLSNTPKLKDMNFTFYNPHARWITEALQTADINDLESISLKTLPWVFSRALELGTAGLGWEDLDRLLVDFWAATSLRAKVARYENFEGVDPRDGITRLLPESATRGAVDFVDPFEY